MGMFWKVLVLLPALALPLAHADTDLNTPNDKSNQIAPLNTNDSLDNENRASRSDSLNPSNRDNTRDNASLPVTVSPVSPTTATTTETTTTTTTVEESYTPSK